MLSVQLSNYESAAYKSCNQLDTHSCPNAILRFYSQWCKPSTIIIDNEKNFFGAEQQMTDYVAALNAEGFEKPTTSKNQIAVQPNAISQFGGALERLF